MYQSFVEMQFFTATNLNWLPLLKDEIHKEIICDSLMYMTENRRCRVYAFVIMPNHIHLLLDLLKDGKTQFQRSFLKYTAQQCLFNIKKKNPELLSKIRSTQSDRKYQFWERKPFWTNITSETAMFKKMYYIHENPVNSKKVECELSEDYKWSSAQSYKDGISHFDFLTLIYKDGIPEGLDLFW